MRDAARETIFALSSGALPSGIAVVRVSGPEALSLLDNLTHSPRPTPRRASLRTLIDSSGDIIDEALALIFTAPNSATGEDIAEFHVHGGSAVVAALLAEIGAHPGCRLAMPGEFTRRSFEAGRLDLSQVEGLADLIGAETEAQRVGALTLSGGVLRDAIENWQSQLIAVFAEIEAAIDFSDEADVLAKLIGVGDTRLIALSDEIRSALADSARGQLLRDGLRVALSGAPNVGKSSLVNALTRSEMSIVSSLPGTTRDAVSARLDLGGVVVTLVDTAGLRDAEDEIEAQGIALARRQIEAADLVLALYSGGPAPERGIPVRTKIDLDSETSVVGGLSTSARTGAGIDELLAWLADWARRTVRPGEPALLTRERHRTSCRLALADIEQALQETDLVLRAEALRGANSELGVITGRVGVEAVLDQLFSEFCIGK